MKLVVLCLPSPFEAVHCAAPRGEVDKFFFVDEGGCSLFDFPCLGIGKHLPDTLFHITEIEFTLLVGLGEFKNSLLIKDQQTG